MTPERIEEIKREAQEESETIYGNCSANITNIELLGLLAALEESQQRIGKLELYIKSLEFSRDEAQKMAHNISKEQGLELFEAQQTIARYKEALNIAMTQNQSHEVFRSIQELTGEGKS